MPNLLPARASVHWDFADTFDATPYEVWIERSFSMSGPFSAVAKTYMQVSYVDRGVDIDATTQPYYRLRLVRRSDNATQELSAPVWFEQRLDVVAQEIRRRNNLLLKEFNGVPILYYTRRTTGIHCPACYGVLEGQRTKSQCLSCFDTGYVLGFYNPILTYINLHEDITQLTQNAETDEYPVRTAQALITGNFFIHFGDLVLERSGERWLVSAWEKTEKLRAKVTYRARLHQVVETDVRYSIPLESTDVFDTLPPSREYTKPYTLQP